MNEDRERLLEYERERLREYMSEMSEDHYCAGWLIGLEYTLWDMLQGGSREWGLGTVSEQEIVELRRLHEAAGGWWRWSSRQVPIPGREPMTYDEGEVFLTTEEWLAHLREREETGDE